MWIENLPPGKQQKCREAQTQMIEDNFLFFVHSNEIYFYNFFIPNFFYISRFQKICRFETNAHTLRDVRKS